jgi:LmbE family N-acetylglucosaminyl deacetylase
VADEATRPAFDGGDAAYRSVTITVSRDAAAVVLAAQWLPISGYEADRGCAADRSCPISSEAAQRHVAILSPHPDDAVLSCFSSIKRSRIVITVFDGVDPDGDIGWWDRESGADSPAAVHALRLAEDREALTLAGSETMTALGYLDHQYRRAALRRAEMIGKIQPLCAGAACLLAPSAVGGHPDHVACRWLGMRVASRLGIPVRLYGDIPYIFDSAGPLYVHGTAEGRTRIDLEAVHLTSEQAALKRHAFGMYRSQFAILCEVNPILRTADAFLREWISQPLEAGCYQ